MWKSKKIAENLENSEHPLYEVYNGPVYRKSKNKLIFYVPSEIRVHVIKASHDDMGHLDVERTLELIKRLLVSKIEEVCEKIY